MIIEAVFENINPKDVAGRVTALIGLGKKVHSIISVSTGGFIFCFQA